MDKRPEELPISSFVLQTLKLQLDLKTFDDIIFWAAGCTVFFPLAYSPKFGFY